MSSLNTCMFIGYMGKDPESRAMPNGDTVTNFSIGVSENWKDKQTGENKSKTEWISCVAWRKTAQVIAQYGHKGRQVFIQGKMATRKWKDKQGNDRWSTEIVVDDYGGFKMLGKKSDSDGRQDTGGGNQSGGQQNRQQGSGGGGSNEPQPGTFDDDIPF